jgi:hypothetical protein
MPSVSPGGSVRSSPAAGTSFSRCDAPLPMSILIGFQARVAAVSPQKASTINTHDPAVPNKRWR